MMQTFIFKRSLNKNFDNSNPKKEGKQKGHNFPALFCTPVSGGSLNRGCEHQCEQGAPEECEQEQRGKTSCCICYLPLFCIVFTSTNRNKIKLKIGD